MTTVFFKIADWIASALIGILVVKSIPYIQKYMTKNYSFYRDKLYREASFKYIQKTGLMTHTLLSNFFSFVLILITFYLLAQVNSLKDSFRNLITPSNLMSKEDLVNQIEKIKHSFIYVDIAKYLVVFIVALLIGLINWQDKRNKTINIIITNFEKRLTILAPEISDKKLLMLRRKWALIESYNDYLSLNSEVDELYTQYGL